MHVRINGKYTPVPPFLRRKILWYVLGILLLVGILIAAIFFGRRWTSLLSIHWTYAFFAFIPYGFGLFFFIRWFTRDFMQLHGRMKAGDVPCWHCGYSLRHLGERGRCPECGREFTRDETLAQWKPVTKQFE
jgi:hypothetical protein